MLFRGEMSEDICLVRTVTEGNDYITFLEKKPLHNRTHLAVTERIEPAQNKSFCPFKAYRHYNTASIVASSAP